MPETEKLRVLIVDDEAPARRDMRRMLGKVKGVEVVGEGKNGLEAVEMVKQTGPDVVLLDIQMPGLDGFQVIARLGDPARLPSVIFVTAYDQYAVRAFEVHAVDYLLKPVDEARLVEAIERVRRVRRGLERRPDIEALLAAVGGMKRRFPVRRGAGHVMVDEEEILYAAVESGEVCISTGQLEGPTNFRSLDELLHELTPGRFFRAHRSYIVNVGKIHEIVPSLGGGYRLRMGGKDGPVVPLSRAQAKELRKLLKW